MFSGHFSTNFIHFKQLFSFNNAHRLTKPKCRPPHLFLVVNPGLQISSRKFLPDFRGTFLAVHNPKTLLDRANSIFPAAVSLHPLDRPLPLAPLKTKKSGKAGFIHLQNETQERDFLPGLYRWVFCSVRSGFQSMTGIQQPEQSSEFPYLMLRKKTDSLSTISIPSV